MTSSGKRALRCSQLPVYSPFIDVSDPLCLAKNMGSRDLLIRSRSTRSSESQSLNDAVATATKESDEFLGPFLQQLEQERRTESPYLFVLERRAMAEQQFRRKLMECKTVGEVQDLVAQHGETVAEYKMPSEQQLVSARQERVARAARTETEADRLRSLESKLAQLLDELRSKKDEIIIRRERDTEQQLKEQLELQIKLQFEQRRQLELLRNRRQLLQSPMDDVQQVLGQVDFESVENPYVAHQFWRALGPSVAGPDMTCRVPGTNAFGITDTLAYNERQSTNFGRNFNAQVAAAQGECGRVADALKSLLQDQILRQSRHVSLLKALYDVLDVYAVLLDHTSDFCTLDQTVQQFDNFVDSLQLIIFHTPDYFEQLNAAHQNATSESLEYSQHLLSVSTHFYGSKRQAIEEQLQSEQKFQDTVETLQDVQALNDALQQQQKLREKCSQAVGLQTQ